MSENLNPPSPKGVVVYACPGCPDVVIWPTSMMRCRVRLGGEQFFNSNGAGPSGDVKTSKWEAQ